MRYIVGIDEVGRGCLTGPVVVTALAMPLNVKFKNQKSKLRDSKKLSREQREEWFRYIKQHPEVLYCVASVSSQVIDKINISAAANLAAYRASNKLITDNRLLLTKHRIYLDGGLYIKSKKYQKEFFTNAETVIKGDEKIKAIALASIVAKVSRDARMTRLHKKYPQYSLDIHKGYGTKVHRAAIRRHGPSEVHRHSFLKNII